MSPTTANKEVVRQFLLAISAKDATTLRSVLAPEAHLTLMIAGVYSPHLNAFPHGTYWDRDGLITREMDSQHQLAGPFELRILSLIAEGDSIAAEVLGKGYRAATGTPYIQHYSYHFQMSRGRIVDIRLYQDTFHLWQVWSDLGAGVEPGYMKVRRVPGIPQGQIDDPAHDSPTEDQVAANKTSVRRFLMAVRNRDPQATREAWSPDGMWSFAIGGDYSSSLRAFEGAPRWDLEGLLYMTQNANKRSQGAAAYGCLFADRRRKTSSAPKQSGFWFVPTAVRTASTIVSISRHVTGSCLKVTCTRTHSISTMSLSTHPTAGPWRHARPPPRPVS